MADGLRDAGEGAREAGGGGGLEADFDGVEGVADWGGLAGVRMSRGKGGGTGELGYAGEDAGDEAFVV